MIQEKIIRFVKNSDFISLRKNERYMLRNLCFRINVVRDVLQNLNSIDQTKNSFFINFNDSHENLFFVFSLREISSLKSFRYVYSSKKGGNVLSFCFPFGYYLFNFALWNAFLTPINEFNFDRLSFGFRPYRSSFDGFLFINKSLFLDSYKNFSVKLKINSIFNLVSIDWLFKNCPVNKNVLKSWFSNIDSLSSDSDISIAFLHTSLFFSLVNFIINGLL